MTKAANLAAAANSTSGYLTASKVQNGGKTTNALAWVNFNGTGTVAIRSSYNVSSITDNGTGDYTVNFATALSDANYAVSGSASADGSGSSGLGFSNESRTTTACRVRIFVTTTANGSDQPAVMVAIFGN
jgi:hypothetical protein